MEQQHRIPQQISSYQFRLIGDMTIKQFLQVGAGAIIAVVIYNSSLPRYVKWPLIIFSFLIGIAFAFFPLEDRPLSKWLILFLKSIYSPTVYTWKKLAVKPKYFQDETGQQIIDSRPAEPPLETDQKLDIAQVIVDDQSSQLQDISDETSQLERKEEEFFSKVNQQFKSASLPEATLITAETEEDMGAQQVPVETAEREKKEVQVIKTSPIMVEKVLKTDYMKGRPHITTSTGTDVTPITGQKAEGAQAAQFFQDGTAPSPPTLANIVVGQVLDETGKLVEAAILEIRDEFGRPVRALKTNQLGHFMIVTPLLDGKYEILVEKQDLLFDPISLEAKGELIPPIVIKAKGRGSIN